MNILETKGLTKSFGGFNALSNFDVKIDEGKIHAIIGPNGAGKTTLFNLISGTLNEDCGEIQFKGTKLNGLKPNDRTALGLARTFQNIRIFGSMTLLENVMLGRHCRTRAGIIRSFLRPPFVQLREEKDIKARSEELIEFVGLSAKKELRASALPYGEQRKLEIARALATDPQLMLLDEPAAGMNQSEKEELNKLILRINQSGKTVLLIEHDMKVVMGISEIITVLNFGEKIAEGKPGEIKDNPLVVEAYLGEEG